MVSCGSFDSVPAVGSVFDLLVCLVLACTRVLIMRRVEIYISVLLFLTKCVASGSDAAADSTNQISIV